MTGLAKATFAAAMALAALFSGGRPTLAADSVQTVVFLRHGEKPAAGLGQITCQGLNRALALPPVIAKNFGKPTAIFAPNPSERKKDRGTPYDYIRPLATIEPTAVSLGMPVNTQYGLSHIGRLRRALAEPAYHQGTVLVAWEHKQIPVMVRRLLADHGGNAASVPDWRDDDFDSFYVVTISRSGKAATAEFRQASEGLNGQPEACPTK